MAISSKFDTIGGFARNAKSFAILSRALYGTVGGQKCTEVFNQIPETLGHVS